jgi:hypothetical protein
MMDGMRVASDSFPGPPIGPRRCERCAHPPSSAASVALVTRPTSSNDESIAPTGKRISIPVMDIESWDEFGMLIGDRAYFDR